jgi:hypothetical protein
MNGSSAQTGFAMESSAGASFSAPDFLSTGNGIRRFRTKNLRMFKTILDLSDAA